MGQNTKLRRAAVAAPIVFASMALPSVSALSDSHAVGVYVSGQELTKGCRLFLTMRQINRLASPDEAFDAGECYGFVVGLLDKASVDAGTTAVLPNGVPRSYCPSESVNANDATEVVALYLDKHPEKRSMAAYFLAREALAEAYPCLRLDD